jgi:hypothetical protein
MTGKLSCHALYHDQMCPLYLVKKNLNFIFHTGRPRIYSIGYHSCFFYSQVKIPAEKFLDLKMGRLGFNISF